MVPDEPQVNTLRIQNYRSVEYIGNNVGSQAGTRKITLPYSIKNVHQTKASILIVRTRVLYNHVLFSPSLSRSSDVGNRIGILVFFHGTLLIIQTVIILQSDYVLEILANKNFQHKLSASISSHCQSHQEENFVT